MRTVPPGDVLLADTKHAKLMRDCLQAGVLREWRVEHLLEQLLILYTQPADRRMSRAKRLEAHEKAIEYALRSHLDLLAKLNDYEARQTQINLARRLLDHAQEHLDKLVALSAPVQSPEEVTAGA